LGFYSYAAKGLNGPTGLALNPSGDLFVSQVGPGSVSRVGADGLVSAYAEGLKGPNGLAFAADGTMYVAEYNAGQVARVGTDRKVTTFATGLANPLGIAIDSAGFIYVSERNAGRITRLTPSGESSVFVKDIPAPAYLAFDKQGLLWVSTPGNGGLITVDAQGKVSTVTQNLFANALGFALDQGGRPLVGEWDAGRVTRWTPEGRAFVASGMTGAHGILFDREGNLLVSEHYTGAILRFGAALVSSAPSFTLVAHDLDGPSGLALSASGELYVASVNRGTVVRPDVEGSPVAYASGLRRPERIAFGPDGQLYIAEWGDGTGTQILRVAPDGTMTRFCRGVSGPMGLAFAPGGDLLVTNAPDHTLARVSPVGVVAPFVATEALPAGPQGLCVDATGAAYVAHDTGTRITRVAPDGTVSPYFTGSGYRLGRVWQTTLGPDGEIYAACEPGMVIAIRSPEEARIVAHGLPGPGVLAFDAQGRLYVTLWDWGAVARFTLPSRTAPPRFNGSLAFQDRATDRLSAGRNFNLDKNADPLWLLGLDPGQTDRLLGAALYLERDWGTQWDTWDRTNLWAVGVSDPPESTNFLNIDDQGLNLLVGSPRSLGLTHSDFGGTGRDPDSFKLVTRYASGRWGRISTWGAPTPVLGFGYAGSSTDVVAPGKERRADQQPDGDFRLEVDLGTGASDRITRIELHGPGDWTTDPTVGWWGLGVMDAPLRNDVAALLNGADGSVGLTVEGRRSLYIAVPNASNFAAKPYVTAVVTFASGRTLSQICHALPVGSLTVRAAGSSAGPGERLALSASFDPVPEDTRVVWLVNGVMGGSPELGLISGDGLYSAPRAIAQPTSVTVTAISLADTNSRSSTSIGLTTGGTTPPPPPVGTDTALTLSSVQGKPGETVSVVLSGTGAVQSIAGLDVTLSATSPAGAPALTFNGTVEATGALKGLSPVIGANLLSPSVLRVSAAAATTVSGSDAYLLVKVTVPATASPGTVYKVGFANATAVVNGKEVQVLGTEGAVTVRQPITPGDLNGDGKVNVKDVILALQIQVGLITATAEQIAAGDLDGNGRVSIADVVRLLRAVVGLQPL
jgi:sugar lactone lactonase YvrE